MTVGRSDWPALNPRDSIVILTGAGISKESGLDTFRDSGGIWQTYPLEDLATPEGFARNPTLVQDFYNARRAQLADPAIQPNAAHQALARLQAQWPGPVLLVTQNVDNLHERGGARRVVHMHGELSRARCSACGHEWSVDSDLGPQVQCSKCGATGTARPAIVWFGEMPLHMDEILIALQDCALFLAIGTSGTVYPAAGFVAQARACGAHTVEINLEQSLVASDFHQHIYGPATTTVPPIVEFLLSTFAPNR